MATATITVLPSADTPPSVEKIQKHPHIYTATLVLITAFGIALRTHALASKSFWLDEGISVQIARLPWRQLFFVLRHREANMALYYVLLHFWLALGTTEGFIRGLSVLFSAATIPVIYGLGTRLFGRNAGLLAAWILSINAYHVRYAQEARAYAMVVFFSALASWLFVRNLQEPGSARWGAYVAASAAVIYCHLFGALVLVAHLVSLAFLPRGAVPWRELGRGARWMAYAVLPMAITVATIGKGFTLWIPATSVGDVLQFFIGLSGNGGRLLLSIEAVAVSAAIFAGWKEWSGSGRTIQGWGYALALLWLSVPVAVVLAVSAVKPMFVPRYLNPCLPGLVLLVAMGIVRLRPPILAWTLGTLITAFSLVGTASYYRADFDLVREDWRTATSYVLDRSMPGDGAFFYMNFVRLPFEFYRSQRRPAAAWPEALVSANGTEWGYHDSLFTYLSDEMQDAGPGGDRVWLVLAFNNNPDGRPNTQTTILRAVYGKGRHLIEEKRITNITILLFARDVPPSLPASAEIQGDTRALAAAKPIALE